MEYIIFAEIDPFKLAKIVNEHCKDNWEPFGSPMVAATTKESWYHYQAMIRKTSDTKENSQNVNQHTQPEIASKCISCKKFVFCSKSIEYKSDACLQLRASA